MTAVVVTRGHATERRERRREITSAIVRLLLAMVGLWALLSGLGYLLTQPLAGTAFERWDGSVDRLLARHRREPWTTLTHLLTFAAETYTVAGVGVIFFIGMRIHLGRWRESLFLLASVGGEVAIFVATTLMIDRHRPEVPHLDGAPPTSSFPSGHTAAACTLYGAMALIALNTTRRSWLRILAVAVAVIAPISVAFARLYRGMHFPTDVMAGALLAGSWLWVTSAIVLRPRR